MADRLLAKIEYINKLAVDIDVGKFTDDQNFYDVTGISDQYTGTLTKVFSEQINVTDDVNGELEGDDTDLSFTKVSGETTGVGDVFERQVDYVRVAYYYEYNDIVGGMIDPDRFPELEYQGTNVFDSVALSISMSFDDSVGVSEDFDYIRAYSLSDSLIVGDILGSLGTGKNVSDITAIADSVYSYSMETPRSDSFLISESIDVIPGKGTSDSFGMTDVLTTSLTKNITDLIEMSESFALSVDDNLSEQTGISESASFVFSAPYTDNVNLSESLDLLVSKSHTDALSMTDSGKILGQSYCDLTYFEDDYIGIKRNF